MYEIFDAVNRTQSIKRITYLESDKNTDRKNITVYLLAKTNPKFHKDWSTRMKVTIYNISNFLLKSPATISMKFQREFLVHNTKNFCEIPAEISEKL